MHTTSTVYSYTSAGKRVLSVKMDFLYKVIFVTVCIGQARVHTASRLPRLSIAESAPSNYFYNNIEGHPGVYSFNYDISDDVTGNSQYRTEDRYENGTVVGAYGYVDAFGAPQRFRYVADQTGYRVFRDSLFKPFINGYQTTLQPADKLVFQPTESSITWTRPKRPNKNKNKVNSNQRRRYNLIGPPSQYAAYD